MGSESTRRPKDFSETVLPVVTQASEITAFIISTIVIELLNLSGSSYRPHLSKGRTEQDLFEEEYGLGDTVWTIFANRLQAKLIGYWDSLVVRW